MAILGFQLNSNLYIRDPLSTELGQSIIQHSIRMIDKMGFNEFTFKKLGAEIESPEASVYRYFENKHRLLIYLIDWYWTWVDFRIDFRNQNIRDAKERLCNCIRIVVEEKESASEVPFVDEKRLQRIIHAEFEKTYLTRQVDADNKEGLFLPYKGLCAKIAAIIEEINPKYPFPRALANTVILSANHQVYYAQHLPSLTEIRKESRRKYEEISGFLESLVINTLSVKSK